ncbi:MAG: DoxX family protein [Acidimicrobiia bacterium]|nr:DoxX family protein [Acidimicrobiia bacterium]MBT8250100.1 DoxX family protein [Acidimicrobiia bacterium]NND13358.1 DoxX family protein [Acidimicrobiia bacterium]NNL28266.1 DoxX family protein [Acidimicrobiia bacterium]
MDVVILIGRILLSMIFIGSGSAGHLMSSDETAAYAESRGVPNAKLLTQLSGIGMLAAGIGVAFGIWADLAVLGIVGYSLIAAFMVHHFWTDDDPMVQQAEMSGFMKNLAIAGGGLILFGFLQLNDGVGLTFTDNLFNF